MDNRTEFVKRLLSLFCTTLKKNIVLFPKALILAIREPKTKVSFLVSVTSNYLFKIKVSINALSVIKYLFVANFPA